MSIDITNSLFELVGTIFSWMNVWYIFKDREIKGVYWPSSFYMVSYGVWSLYYYIHLFQWYSLSIAIFHVLANTIWLIFALFFHNKRKTDEN